MNVLIECPRSNAGEWRFRLFGAPVAVKFWFWIAVIVMCTAQETGTVLIWIAVCLASILIHELGHVYALRSFGDDGEIFLYGWGGLTVSRRGVRGLRPEVAVALAGPAAGFAAAIATACLAMATGAAVRFGWHHFLPVLQASPGVNGQAIADYRWLALLNDLLHVNFYWALVNLLPVYPLDGWRAAHAVIAERDRGGARRKAFIWSAAASAIMVVLGLVERNLYLIVIFALLGTSSAQAVEAEPRSPRGHGRWRQ